MVKRVHENQDQDQDQKHVECNTAFKSSSFFKALVAGSCLCVCFFASVHTSSVWTFRLVGEPGAHLVASESICAHARTGGGLRQGVLLQALLQHSRCTNADDVLGQVLREVRLAGGLRERLPAHFNGKCDFLYPPCLTASAQHSTTAFMD